MSCSTMKAGTRGNLLPDEVVNIIVTCMAQPAKKKFMASCRKAFRMVMLTEEVTLKITKHTKFAGIKKVLDSFPARLHLKLCPSAEDPEPLSALAVFMDMLPSSCVTEAAASCRWDCITRATIMGTMLRCLVSRFIALACPQLSKLKIVRSSSKEYMKKCMEQYMQQHMEQRMFTTDPGEALPLTVCNTLRHLVIKQKDWKLIQLPPAHHSPAELRQCLPNIDTLVMTHNSNAALMQAFATQLTRLEFDPSRDNVHVNQQLISQCSHIQRLGIPWLILPDSTANLKVLEFLRSPNDNHYERLLQLSCLRELHIVAIADIQQDWSHHACPWQELHLAKLGDFTRLANLNLSSLKKLCVGANVAINLPDPATPGSLLAVQRAAANLKLVRQFIVKQHTAKTRTWFGECGQVSFSVPDGGEEHESTAAEMISVAAQSIGQFKVCDCRKLVKRVRPLRAVLQWGTRFVESVCLGGDYETPPLVWQALQQLQRLSSVLFWPGVERDQRQTQFEHFTAELIKISSTVKHAAVHYIVPTQSSLRLQFEFQRDLAQDVVTICKDYLIGAIKECLPIGSKLASVELVSVEGSSMYKCGMASCSVRPEAYWVVVVQPLQLSA